MRPEAAIAVAKVTPLYRIDGAFAAVRKGALNAPEDSWAADLDIEAFVEAGETVVFALKKADDTFYGVVFASKGSSQLQKLYDEARASVDAGIAGFDEALRLLRSARAPAV